MLVRAFLAEALDAVTHDAARAGIGSRRRRLVAKAGRHERRNPIHRRAGREIRLSRAIRRDFPILTQDDPRQAVGVPRQRGVGAEAACRHRCHGNAMETQYANVHRGLHLDERSAPPTPMKPRATPSPR